MGCFSRHKGFFVEMARKAGGHQAKAHNAEEKLEPDPALPSYMYYCAFCVSIEKHTNYGNYGVCSACLAKGTDGEQICLKCNT